MTIKEFIPILVGMGSIIVGLASIFAAYKLNKKMLRSKQIEDKRKDIIKKLDEFYGPFQQLRGKSKMLYDVFSSDKKRNDNNFRTLSALLDGVEFNDNEKKLLEQIIKIGNELEDLIIKKSGVVEDEELRKVLVEAATHFNIISLAYNGQLKGRSDLLVKHVFPNNLDIVIEKQIKKLLADLEKLDRI